MKTNHNHTETLIIGAGAGGLSMAIILAKLGRRVTVVEKNGRPGGMMRSYVRNGVHCEVGVHYLGALGAGQVLRRFFDYLGVTQDIPVTRMGRGGVIDRYVFGDFTFDLPEGLETYERNLRRAFPEEQEKITGIMDLLKQSARQMDSLDFLYGDQMNPALLELSAPMGETLEGLGCSAGLKAVLGAPCFWIGVPLAECPCFYHGMTLASYLFSSWRLDCSGADMADAFVKRLESLGGKVITGQAVQDVRVASGRVEGLTLASGERLDAPMVIAAVHPAVVLGMLPPDSVKPSYRRRVSALENTQGVFSVTADVGKIENEIPHNTYWIDTDGSGAIADAAFIQLRKDKQSGRGILSVLTSGKAEFWKDWESTLTGRRGDAYNKRKMEYGETLLRKAEALIGPFRQAKILDVYTPLTLRDWVNSPDGSAYGVLRSSRQMLSAALINRTHINGLFLAGQNVMAPGILGTLVGSFITARAIIGRERFNNEIVL